MKTSSINFIEHCSTQNCSELQSQNMLFSDYNATKQIPSSYFRQGYQTTF